METVIGCTQSSGAKILFSAPAIDGETFREVVDIYACGPDPRMAQITAGYASKLLEDESKNLYFVWARSFMTGRGPGGQRFDDEEPKEFFDIVYCVPVETFTDELIEEFKKEFSFGGFGGGKGCGHGGPGGNPGRKPKR